MRVLLARKLRLLASVSVLGLAGGMLGMAAAAPASAATTASHGGRSSDAISNSTVTFYVVNFNSLNVGEKLCLGISGGKDDAPAVQWDCNDSANQTWHWGDELGDTGYYQLVNGDDQCLGVAGGSDTEGADVVGWTCLGSGHPDQYWTLDDASEADNFYPIFNYHSGYVLGVAGNSYEVGASVVQWHFQDEPNNQYWELTPT
jgi:hypothetical protein